MTSHKETSSSSSNISDIEASLEELVSIITSSKTDDSIKWSPAPTANCKQLILAYLHLESKPDNSITVVRYSHPNIIPGFVTFAYAIYMVKLCIDAKQEYWIVPYNKNRSYIIDQYFLDEYFLDECMIEDFKKNSLL